MKKYLAMVLALALLIVMTPAISLMPVSAAQKTASINFLTGAQSGIKRVEFSQNFSADIGGTAGVQNVGEPINAQMGVNRDFIRIEFDEGTFPDDTKEDYTLTIVYYDAFASYAGMTGGKQSFYVSYISGTEVNQKETPSSTFYFLNRNSLNTAVINISAAMMDHSQDGGFDIGLSCLKLGSNGTDGKPITFPTYIRSIDIKKTMTPDEYDPPEVPEKNNVNDMSNKSVAGYQMWFKATSSNSGWFHWNGSRPGEATGSYNIGDTIPTNVSVEMYPIINEYPETSLYDTNFPDHPDGTNSAFFNSDDEDVIAVHMQWMKDNGVDGFAIQRFYGTSSKAPQTSPTHMEKARDAAEKYGRGFYVMYDMSGTASKGYDTFQGLQLDWIHNVEGKGLTSSPSYYQMDGKPVVCIWGIHSESDTYMDNQAATDIAKWFKARGVYVICGTPDNGFHTRGPKGDTVYAEFDMISPWTVGRYRWGTNGNGITNWNNNNVRNYMTYCETRDIDFQPAIFPGSAWGSFNHGNPNDFERLSGEFLWRQAVDLKTRGCERVYFSMFDEYDEGTAIMKAATDSFDIPTGKQYFLTHSADGNWVSSDFYLRLAGQITKLMRGEVSTSTTVSIPYSTGPIYFRNSYEKRYYIIKDNEKKMIGFTWAPIDPCVQYNSMWDTSKQNISQLPVIESAGSQNVTFTNVNSKQMYDTYAAAQSAGSLYHVNGIFQLNVTGTVQAGTASRYVVTNKTKILVSPSMTMSYKEMPIDELGKYLFIDLQFDDGTLLSAKQSSYSSNLTMNQWNTVDIALDSSLIGKYITAIVVAFDRAPSGTGSFEANFDDLLIQDDTVEADARIYPATATIAAGNKQAMTLIKRGGLDVTWSSSNPAVASVDESGVVTAIRGGTTDIVALIDGQEVICKVTVTGVPMTGMSLDKAVLFLLPYGEAKLNVVFEPDDTTADRTTSWSSSDSSIATVDVYGNVMATDKHGSCVITATVGEYSAQCTVTVGDVVYGDANSDGNVDAKDARLVLRRSLGKVESSGLNELAADVNNDGFVDAKDARIILRFALDKIDIFPVQQV